MWFRYGSRSVRVVTGAALAKWVQNKVEAAYARSDLFERRRVLMEDWAVYLAGRHDPQPLTVELAKYELASKSVAVLTDDADRC